MSDDGTHLHMVLSPMKKLSLILIGLCVAGNAWAAYVTDYPPAYNSTYVKSTTQYDANWAAHKATNPAYGVTGDPTQVTWLSQVFVTTNQRFHIDLGAANTIVRVYYENQRYNAYWSGTGVKSFTMWGSNEATAFAELTYATDTNWTQLTTSVAQFDRHTNDANADPKYFTVTNSTPYRYYAFKFANNWGTGDYMGLGKIELQYDDAPAATRNRYRVVS